MKKMILFFALFLAMSIFLSSRADATIIDNGISDQMHWGRWAFIKGDFYRQCFAPGPSVMGVQYYASPDGNFYSRPVLPCGELTKREIPDWFSLDGMGLAPDVSVEKTEVQEGFASAMPSMSWGRWMKIEGIILRGITPAGGRLLGAQWYSDVDGNCYTRPVIPNAKLRKVESPEWFTLKGMGLPPVEFLTSVNML